MSATRGRDRLGFSYNPATWGEEELTLVRDGDVVEHVYCTDERWRRGETNS
jgi:hypothetical protein